MPIRQIVLINSLFCSLFLASCQLTSEDPAFARSKLAEKLVPSEQFFRQRAFPDSLFDHQAFQKGLEQARRQVVPRDPPAGFSEAWEVQGPGNLGSRINTVAVDPDDPDRIFIGYAHGGIFRTLDGGLNWEAVFDDQPALSIGHLAIDPSDPDRLYAGTGDVNIPGGFFIGDGLYRSVNGGDTWQNLGLEETGIISKILLHPDHPDTLFVATMGVPSRKDDRRGLFRSYDGGVEWEQVFFPGEQTGVIDLLMLPDDPMVLFAATWERYRDNFNSVVAGETAGIWRSNDGGNTWVRSVNGLPTGASGRVGLTVCQSDPNILYAVFVGEDSEIGGVYRSANAGLDWNQVADRSSFEAAGNGSPLGGFGWYFGKVRVNPANPDDLFLLGVDLWRSLDGGATWQLASPPWWSYQVHADKHDLVFTDSDSMILATDGGLYISHVSQQSWRDLENNATTQFYRVGFNPHFPDLYYGGAQDNGTSAGNREVINDWFKIWGGDGFQPAFHPEDPLIFYVETQNGNLTGTSDGGSDWFPADQGLAGDRKNWDMPYMISRHDPDVLYAGTYRLMRSDAGPIPVFEPITDDLTEGIDDRYHTISALDESPLVPGLVLAGTSDGKVWRVETGRQGGEVAISDGLPRRYVTAVKASAEQPDRYFVSFSGYRFDEYLPHLFRSDDQGLSWTDISGNLPPLGVNDLVALPGSGDSILFAATDGGVYATVDGGRNWDRLGSGLPFVPVFDMVLNPVRNELVAGTYARSIQTYPLRGIRGLTSVSGPNPTANNRPGLEVFPNPATESLFVRWYNPEPGHPADLVIVNAEGQICYSDQLTGNGRQSLQLQVAHLSSGAYTLAVRVRHKVWRSRFIKL